jgi:hypothetical protein
MRKQKQNNKSTSRFSVRDVLGAPDQTVASGTSLGHSAAVTVVCHCAGTSPLNLDKSLSALGVNGIPFQMCVFGSVSYMGYEIQDVSDIPDGPDDLLIAVVDAIQNAPKRG